MPKASFYAVHRGINPGIYTSWPSCEQQIKGFPKAVYKKFSTEAEARAFVESGSSASELAEATAALGTSGQLSSDLLVHKNAPTIEKETEIKDEHGWDVVYTDGACRGNGKEGAIAGIGVWWGLNDPRNLAERCPGDQTNNRAELIAIIRALETAPQGSRPLLIKTDSQYSISCIRDWIPSWRQRGWKTTKGEDVKNKGIIVYLATLLDRRGQEGQRVQLQHVSGHVGISGNESADTLAGIGASKPALPDRDWSLLEEFKSAGKEDIINQDFQYDEDDLLSDEALVNGDFD